MIILKGQNSSELRYARHETSVSLSTTRRITQKYEYHIRVNAVHPDVLFDSQGIKIIQSNTSFVLLKYTCLIGKYTCI